LACAAAGAQQALPRITQHADETSLVRLKGSLPAIARSQYDQGEADGSTQLTGVRLLFSRTAEQEAALDAYLAQLQDPSSANYHKWLTPEQFGKLYGPADSDIAAMTAWLQSHGLTVSSVAPGRTGISFSGSVSQLESAFHTSIHSFAINGRQFYSNTTEPQIPAALNGVVAGVTHLNTHRPQPLSIRGRAGMVDSSTKQLKALDTADDGPYLTVTGSSGYSLYVVPGDAATIYDTPNSTFNASYSGTNYTGSGVVIGVGGDAAISSSIVGAYRTNFLGSSTLPTITTVTTTQNSSDAGEAYIDTELAGALAPAATIHYYMDDNYLGIEQMLSDNAVDIFSLSFGECELGMSTSDNAEFNNWWKQAAAQGITVVVASGDSGSAGCDATKTSSGATVTQASGGLAVSGFASTPYNIAVGGTDFYPLASSSSFAGYVSTSEGSASTYYRTALSYIPESTWNNSSEYDTLLSANVPWTAVSGYTSNANIVAGSGGKSNCSTNTSTDNSNGSVTAGSCTSGYAKPSWQTGTGVPADGARDIPDVSLMAGNGYDSATWLICDNTTSSGYTLDCETQSNGSAYFDGYGGTSTSAPAFAGILALLVQKTGGRLGQADSVLYSLFNGSHAASVYHDITVGNNSVPCKSGTTNCSLNTAGYYFESGYNTTTGYDLATGMGSVDAANLLTYWSTAATTPSGTFTIAASPSTASISKGSTASTVVTLTNSGSYAGTVKITCVVSSSVVSPTDLPTCSVGTSSITLSSTTTTGTATITLNTTSSSASLARPRPAGKGRDGKGSGWAAGSGAALALLFFLGVPAGRRNWRSLVGALVLLAVLGTLSACGSGTTSSSSGSGSGSGSGGTTSATYTVTITGNDANTTTKEAVFTVTVS
jgi:subtilase family serine protease